MLMTYFTSRAAHSPLTPILTSCRSTIGTLGFTSGVINLLTLTGSIFMMQVYDRVLGSQSMPTLVGLSLIAVVAYMFQGWLEALRGKMLTLLGEKIDIDLSDRVHAAGMKLATGSPTGPQEAGQAFRDLEAIRTFVTGQGLVAALDIPWVLLYVVVATLLHPLFGITTVIAALVLVWLTWKTERESKAPVKEAFEAATKRSVVVDANLRGSESMHANGMGENRRRMWMRAHESFLTAQRKATFVIGGYTSVAKTIRMVLQSFVLGLGAYLAIKGQITTGAIIAASIIVARALSPIDQAIASWRPFVAARDAHERLSKLLVRQPVERSPFELAPPSRSFAVTQLAVAPPGAQTLAMAGVSFALKAGDVLGVIGTSGSGKSTLVKAIVGVWKPARGSIAFDDSGPQQWDEQVLGRAMGYLAQDVQLFDGTIAANIARFDEQPAERDVQKAAVGASLDGHIRSKYPQTGYDTQIGPGGGQLAGGLRQRVGLARALYGDPFLLVLDEPNSNLDEEGSAALRRAILDAKARGAIVIIVTHKNDILRDVDYLLVMANGQMEMFGPRAEVMRRLREKMTPPGAAPGATFGNTSGHAPSTPILLPGTAPVNGARPNGQHADGGSADEQRPAAASGQTWSTAPLRMSKVPNKRGN